MSTQRAWVEEIPPFYETAAKIVGARKQTRLTYLRAKVRAGQGNANDRATVRLSAACTAVLTGLDDISTWDDEELRRGTRRNRDGTFKGTSRILVVPTEVHNELVRRTLSQAQTLMTNNLVQAVEALTEIATNPGSEDKDKLKAIQIIMDRVMGKEVQKVELGGEAKWEAALRVAIKPMRPRLETPGDGGVAEEDEEFEIEVDADATIPEPPPYDPFAEQPRRPRPLITDQSNRQAGEEWKRGDAEGSRGRRPRGFSAQESGPTLRVVDPDPAVALPTPQTAARRIPQRRKKSGA